jgi:hypothetical protein
MSSNAANGTTVSFGSTTIGKIRSVENSAEGAKIDLTHLTSTQKEYVIGLADNELSLEVIGHPAAGLAVGAYGSVAITWNDGTTDDLGDLTVASRKSNGEVDGEISTSLTLVPKAA